MGARTRQRGMSLLEFTLVVAVFLSVLVFAMTRIAEVRIGMERTAVQHTEAAMRTALAIRFAELYTQGRLDEAGEWEGANPLALIEGAATLPTREDADLTAAGPGRWYYDAAAGEVVYEVAYPEGVMGDAATGRWRVVVLRNDRPRGLDLETVEAIEWRGED